MGGETVATNWEEIEKEYITTDIGQRELAAKYGVATPTINNHSKAGNWVKKREAFRLGKLDTLENADIEILQGEGYYVMELGPEAEDMKPKEKCRLHSLKMKQIPKIDTSDPFQVQNRINSYFDFCFKNEIPTSPVDLAKWLRITLRSFERWRDGDRRESTHQRIAEEAWDRIHSDLVNRVQTGAISPPSGIFLLKNWFAYKDVKDLVVEPKNPLGELQDKKALEQRIMGTVVLEQEETPPIQEKPAPDSPQNAVEV